MCGRCFDALVGQLNHGADRYRAMVVAVAERCVTLPGVGEDDAAGLDSRRHEAAARKVLGEAAERSGTTARRSRPERCPLTSTAPTTIDLLLSC